MQSSVNCREDMLVNLPCLSSPVTPAMLWCLDVYPNAEKLALHFNAGFFEDSAFLFVKNLRRPALDP